MLFAPRRLINKAPAPCQRYQGNNKRCRKQCRNNRNVDKREHNRSLLGSLAISIKHEMSNHDENRGKCAS
jgi:hypothetical protein